MIRGAVHRVDLGDPRGHEQGGRRYGVVLSPTNMPWSVATIVPTSTSAQRAIFRPVLEIAGQETVLLVDRLRVIDTDYVVGSPVDFLLRDDLDALERAVQSYLGII